MAGFFQNLLKDVDGDTAINALNTLTNDAVVNPTSSKLQIQPLPVGFGSYLTNILPNDVATSAGAFSASLQQIRNIKSVPIEKFAQVVSNIETTKDLDLVNGTNVPVNTALATAGTALIALGSGPNGTYTMSDILGAMSGLPYPWQKIENSVKDLQTSTLATIYRELYLAVTWEQATATIQYTYDGISTYTTTGVTLTDPGGGYGRGGASAPIVTVNGATVTATIGTDDTNISTFGRVTGLSFTPGTTGSVPTISIDYPPGGTSFSNSTVQGYIDQANNEIASIQSSNPTIASLLNTYYEQTGTALTLEQQARDLCFLPVPVPKDTTLSQFPTTLYSFIDTIPTYAINTEPHMYAQTLEAICDRSTVGGQSIIAMMRQERNQARLVEVGIPLDNNIPGQLDPMTTKLLIANGTVVTATGTTPMSNMYPEPVAMGLYDASDDNYYLTNLTAFDGTSTQLDINNTQLIVPELLSKGAAIEPGSLAGSNYQNLVPPQLNTAYTSDILPSSVYSVAEAIEQVVKCNCDCWID